MKKNPEYEKFDTTMQRLMKVSHGDLKAALEAERAAKKRKPKTSASGRASRDKAN
jgi:hypothetical protein